MNVRDVIIGHHTGSRVRRQPRRLLVGSLAAEDDSQAATCSQRVVSNCGKYDRRPTHFRRHVLHWLDVTDRIRFRLCVQVYKCQHSMAPGYLVDLRRPVSSIDGLKHLRSANRGQLQVPRIRMSTYGSRAFGHAGPSTWNTLQQTFSVYL